MNNSISTKLLQSCEKLFSDGIINESQYHLCKTSIGESSTLKELKISEKQIFGENRTNKEGIYNKFIKEVDDTIKAIFTHIDNNPGNLVTTVNNQEVYNPNNMYFSLLVNLDYFMNNLIDYVTQKSVNRYFKKESIHFQQLNSFYNQLDKNRKELKNVDKNFKTLDEKNNIYSDKLNFSKRKINTNYIILMLVLIFNIIGIIVYVKF